MVGGCLVGLWSASGVSLVHGAPPPLVLHGSHIVSGNQCLFGSDSVKKMIERRTADRNPLEYRGKKFPDVQRGHISGCR